MCSQSMVAVVNAARVRVDVFQTRERYSYQQDSGVEYCVFQIFQVSERPIRYSNSARLKSFSAKKLRPWNTECVILLFPLSIL